MNLNEAEKFYDECYEMFLCKGSDFMMGFERKLSECELSLIKDWFITGSQEYCSSFLNPRFGIFGINRNSEMYKRKMYKPEMEITFMKKEHQILLLKTFLEPYEVGESFIFPDCILKSDMGNFYFWNGLKNFCDLGLITNTSSPLINCHGSWVNLKCGVILTSDNGKKRLRELQGLPDIERQIMKYEDNRIYTKDCFLAKNVGGSLFQNKYEDSGIHTGDSCPVSKDIKGPSIQPVKNTNIWITIGITIAVVGVLYFIPHFILHLF